jgi:Flp pilus assembly protein TadB
MAAGDYIEPVFSTIVGRLIMTAAILLVMLSWAVSAKIMRIDI